MKKTFLPLLAISLLLTGCKLFPSSGSSSNSSSATSSISGSSGSNSSSAGSSSSGQSSSSSEETSEEDVGDVTKLGLMSITDAKAWLEAHKSEIPVNTQGNGVDKTRMITIRGNVVGRFDTVKTKKDFGLDQNKPGRVVLGDENAYMVCESDTSSKVTCLYDKIGADYVNEDTSKYEVTGYPAICMGKLELMIPSSKDYYEWNDKLTVGKDVSKYIDETIELSAFFNKVKDTKYNCAGHGYDKVYKVTGLTCYYLDASSGIYLFTDGTRLLKVLKENLTATVGQKYDVVGIATTKDYAPAIRAMAITAATGEAATLDYSGAISQTTAQLLANKTSKDDTNTRFDNFVTSFGNIYKSEVYICAETDSGKLNFGFSDDYKGNAFIEGKELACSKSIAFIDNKNFWNTDEVSAAKYNGYYKDYLSENVKTTIYYIPWQISEYKTYNKKSYPLYKVFLLPETIPPVVSE